jgi:hypothetical protein
MHAFLIGSHFVDPSRLIPAVIDAITLTLILLEVVATMSRAERWNASNGVKGLAFAALMCFALLGFWMSNYVYTGLPSAHLTINFNAEEIPPNSVFEVDAKVNLVNDEKQYILVDQAKEIPNVMPAMVMIYDITNANREQISEVRQGDSVHLTLATDAKGVLGLRNISRILGG